MYKDLRSLFHDPNQDHEKAFSERSESSQAVHLDMSVSGNQAFFVIAPEVYDAALKASRLDKEIAKLTAQLPGKAIISYTESCLIDEIVITNEIEGVNSTRREISEVLDSLAEQDRRKRFHGLVQKYLMLCSGKDIPIRTCDDIRAIYDELVLDEIKESDPKNVPDGKIFRNGPVSVLNAAQIPIHQGVEPESKICSCMESALDLLNDETVLPLARISAFHFLFGYVHPFYDGNGRTNRFISSYAISHEYEPIVGFRLSYAVKKDISKYYKAFSICEHTLNRGDITPFVIAFSEIVVAAMESMRDSLKERLESMRSCSEPKNKLCSEINKSWANDFIEVIVNASLFSANGITVSELSTVLSASRQTIYLHLRELERRDLSIKERIGKKVYWRIDIDKMKDLYSD